MNKKEDPNLEQPSRVHYECCAHFLIVLATIRQSWRSPLHDSLSEHEEHEISLWYTAKGQVATSNHHKKYVEEKLGSPTFIGTCPNLHRSGHERIGNSEAWPASENGLTTCPDFGEAGSGLLTSKCWGNGVK